MTQITASQQLKNHFNATQIFKNTSDAQVASTLSQVMDGSEKDNQQIIQDDNELENDIAKRRRQSNSQINILGQNCNRSDCEDINKLKVQVQQIEQQAVSICSQSRYKNSQKIDVIRQGITRSQGYTMQNRIRSLSQSSLSSISARSLSINKYLDDSSYTSSDSSFNSNISFGPFSIDSSQSSQFQQESSQSESGSNFEENILRSYQGPESKPSKIQYMGLILCIWEAKNNRKYIQIRTFQTAFSISPSIIITSLHGVYEPNQKRPYDKAYYIPINGTYQNDIKIPIRQDFQKCQNQDLAILMLNQPLPIPIQNHLRLGIFSENYSNQMVELWGYSSSTYNFDTPRKGQKIQRDDLKGKYIQIKRKNSIDFIEHKIMALKGHSGSPIVRQYRGPTQSRENRDIKMEVIGIHTHKNIHNDYYEGPAITNKLRNKIIQFSSKLLNRNPEIEQLRLKYQ